MKTIMKIFVVAITVWIFASWCDIVADNREPNPEHSKYNFFCMMFQEEYEIDGYVADAGIIVDMNGDAWQVDTSHYKVGEKLTAVFNDMGTPQIEDDEVIELYQ